MEMGHGRVKSSSVGCVAWSVAYALAMFVAALVVAASLLLAGDRNDEARKPLAQRRHRPFHRNSFLYFILYLVHCCALNVL
jgi:hypothetical protein